MGACSGRDPGGNGSRIETIGTPRIRMHHGDTEDTEKPQERCKTVISYQ